MSNVIAFATGLATSFTLNKLWSFEGQQKYSGNKQFIIYFSLAMFNLIFTSIFIKQSVELGLYPSLAKFLSMIMIVVWNFIIFKKIIFKL